MLSAKNSESSICSFVKIYKLKVLFLAFLLLLTGFIFSMQLSGCKKNESYTDQSQIPDPVLPTAADEHLKLMSAINIPGANLVVTDGGSIFFRDRNDNFVKAGPDGSSPEILLEASVSWPFLADDQLFFAAGPEFGSLSKIKTDGSNQVRIGSKDMNNLIYFNDYIYAIELPEGKVIRVKPDGNGREVIYEDPVSTMILHQDMFFLAGKTSDQGIIRYNPESKISETIVNITAGCIQTENDFLFFTDLQQQYQLFALNLQSENTDQKPELILNQVIEKPFIVSNGKLFYIDSSKKQQIYSIGVDADEQLDPDKAVVAVDDAADRFVVIYPFIYYLRPDQNRLYRTFIGNNRPVPVG
jgi:hypothetical protein